MSFFPNLKIGFWNGWLFMSVFILQMLIMWLVDKKVWNRTHVPESARQNPLERHINAIANLFWLLALVCSVFLPLQLKTTWFYLGFSVFLIGVILLSTATFSFITTPIDQLISKGIYQFSRHPMYLATFFICLGAGIATTSLALALLSLLIALCFQQEALIEERHCRIEYGNDYLQYSKRVARWLGLPR